MKFVTTTKIFLLITLVFANTFWVLGQVNIIKPTGGQNISNDLSSVGTAPAYTGIGNIVIAETAPGDFSPGTNLTITLDRPTGWQFNAGIGSATGSGPNVTNVSITSVTATRITLRYTVTGTSSGTNAITIAGIQAQSTAKTLGVESFIFRQGGTGVIKGLNAGTQATGTQVAPLSKVAGTATQLLALLPNQTLSPGTATGKGGTAATPTAGVPFNVVVYATDYAWNPTSSTDQIAITANDTYAVLPANNALNNANGQSFSVALKVYSGTASQTITATNVSNGTIAASTTTATKVNAGPFSKLLVLLPGETLDPGSPTGKTGVPSTPVSGITYTVTAYSVDDYWNKVSATNNISIATTGVTNFTPPAAANLSGGARAFNLLFKTAGETPYITATNNTNNAITAYSTGLPLVLPGALVKLQILLPNEVSAPGTTTGKTGVAFAGNPPVAGVSFPVVVNAVDANWNIVAATETVNIANVNATYAPSSIFEANKNLVGGTTTFNVILNRAATNHQLIVTDVTTPSITAASTATFSVVAGSFAKLLILLPWETSAPGTATGKTGTGSIPANANLSVVVRAVDANWNFVTGITDQVQLSTTDPNGSFTTNNLALSNGTRTFTARLKAAGNTNTITVNNTTDNTKTAYTTDGITVTATAFTKLVLILPGETDAPGATAGKTGTPISQVAGQPFNVLVKASDAYGNTVTSVNDIVGFTATSDIYAQLPPNSALVNGILTATVTYRIGSTTNNRRLTASDVTDGTKTASVSPVFTVNTGAYDRLLILLPGETYTPGSPNGKVGAAANQEIGTAFNITVRAVDAAWNAIAGIDDLIQITANDLAAVLPANATLVDGVKTNFSVKLNTVSTSATLTATNLTDGTKTAYTTNGITVSNPSGSTDFYRSAMTGNWNNSSTWESSPNGNTGWQPATRTPTSTAKGILVKNGHAVTVTANVTVDDVLVENGASVSLSGGNLTIAKGTAAVDFRLEGLLVNNGRTITTTGVLQVANGGKYQHNFITTSGTIPTASWDDGSICEVIGYTNYAGEVLGSNQSFADFVWNVSTQMAVGNPFLSNNFTAKNFTVTSTGNGTLNFGATGGTAIVSGNYIQNGGAVRVNKTSGIQYLYIGGNFAVNGGSFADAQGISLVTFDGNTAQSLSNNGPAITFQNLALANGGAKSLVSGNFIIGSSGVLTLGANTTLNANGRLTLLSDALSSARITPIPANSVINGEVTVQRYISGGNQDPFRTYRMLSSPIYDNNNPGNRTYSFTQFIDNIIVTGKGGAANGFDETPANGASAWIYDPNAVAANKFVALENINTSLSIGKGSYLFYRGDRTNLTAKTVAPYMNPEGTIVDFKGILNQQNVNVPLVYNATANGYNLLGNPYASSIDWNSSGIIKSNLLNNTIRVWNPATRQYSIYDGLIGANGGSNVIPVGQAFFVQAANGSASVAFTENAKLNGQPSQLLMSSPEDRDVLAQKVASTYVTQGSELPMVELRTQLTRKNTPYAVEAVAVFKNGKSAAFVEGEDVSYLKGQEVFLSTLSSDGKELTINYMPEINSSTRLKLAVDTSPNSTGDYSLAFNCNNLPAGYRIKLSDNYLSTTTMLQNGDSYDFHLNKQNSASFGADRFSISFEVPATLPVEMGTFTATKNNLGVLLRWSTLTEKEHRQFELWRAGDDNKFKLIRTEAGKGNASNYVYTDKTPLIGNNYYKLVGVDNDGKSEALAQAAVNYTGDVNGSVEIINVFPNPAVSIFTVRSNAILKSEQQFLKLVNTAGQIVWSKSIAKNELNTGYQVNIAHYPTGVYMVELYEGNGQRIGQSKVIKQ